MQKTDNISANTFVVYGSSNCSMCKQTIEVLNSKDKKFIYKSFPDDYTIEELTDLVGYPTRSVPQIFVIDNDHTLKYIGGFQEFVKAIKD